MGNDEDIRASDSDRDAVVVALRDAYAAGRLTLEEFDERTTAAYAGRTWGALRELTRDLPEKPAIGADLPPRPAAALPAAPRVTEEAMPPALQARHRPPFVPLIPIIVIWALVLSHGVIAVVLAPLVVLFLVSVLISRGRRNHDRSGSPGGRDPH